MPLKGTCTTSIPAIERSISPAKWVPLPTPAEEKLSWPGLAFAAATSSATVFTPRDGGTTSTYFEVAVRVTPERSANVSYGSFGVDRRGDGMGQLTESSV